MINYQIIKTNNFMYFYYIIICKCNHAKKPGIIFVINITTDWRRMADLNDFSRHIKIVHS